MLVIFEKFSKWLFKHEFYASQTFTGIPVLINVGWLGHASRWIPKNRRKRQEKQGAWWDLWPAEVSGHWGQQEQAPVGQ